MWALYPACGPCTLHVGPVPCIWTLYPACGPCTLQDAAQAAREKLYQQLAAKTKPDLEPVMASVLEGYDGSVVSKVRRLLLVCKTPT